MFALQIENVSKTYKEGHQALKFLSLNVEEGDFFALLGPNGAGKSTLIGIICSLVIKSSGNVKIFDADIDDDFAKAKTYLGIVPQEFNFNNFEKVYNIPLSQAGYYGLPLDIAKQRTEKYLKLLDLWDKRDTKAMMLSGGMKRRLMIARAMVHEPRLLILDEPTAGVDIELRRSMWDMLTQLNQQGTTIVLTTHYLEEAESLCRNIGIIDGGVLIELTTVKSLLRRLNKETFIIDVATDLASDFSIEGYPCKRIDEHSFEVEMLKSRSINQLFAALTEMNVEVVSMRNKSNRLEETFVSLLKQNEANL